MADRICLAAWTPPGANFPPYINISFENHLVEVTVRSNATLDGKQGPEGRITMSFQDFRKTVDEAMQRFNADILNQTEVED
jgi:hypothetical protein